MSVQGALSYYQAQNTENMSIKIEFNRNFYQLGNENGIPLRSEFILCKSCFWCASNLHGYNSINICPVCKMGFVQAMLITNQEL
jgi:hypothetical protein